MRDYISLGPTPEGEGCQQLGTPTYDATMARRESVTYRDQLTRRFKDLLERVPEITIGVRSHICSDGTYIDVVVYFDPDKDAQMEAALEIERDLPERWDSVSMAQLVEAIDRRLKEMPNAEN